MSADRRSQTAATAESAITYVALFKSRARFLAPLRMTYKKHFFGTLLTLLVVTGLLARAMRLAGVGLTAQSSNQPPSKRAVEQPARAQPIPFSHKLHTRFVQRCEDCHAMPDPGWDMTYPAEAKCMECHATIKNGSPAVVKLAEYWKEQKPVPWVQIYKVPDYVFFSHKVHWKKAGIACEVCHGSVTEREVVTQEKPTTMAACVDCHRERHAAVTCRSCHNR